LQAPAVTVGAPGSLRAQYTTKPTADDAVLPAQRHSARGSCFSSRRGRRDNHRGSSRRTAHYSAHPGRRHPARVRAAAASRVAGRRSGGGRRRRAAGTRQALELVPPAYVVPARHRLAVLDRGGRGRHEAVLAPQGARRAVRRGHVVGRANVGTPRRREPGFFPHEAHPGGERGRPGRPRTGGRGLC